MTKRIFRSICIVALVVLLASVALITGLFYDYFASSQSIRLKNQTELAAQGVTNEGIAFFEGLEINDYRITWIAADGHVLYDTDVNAADMENHLAREEVQAAFANGYGESSRYSSTLTEKQLYAAQRLPDGTVLRLSYSHYSVLTLFLGILRPLIIIAVVGVVLSLLLALWLSKKVVRPLNSIDLDNTVEAPDYPELSPLFARINSQKAQLKAQEEELKRQKREFLTATEHMSEGLILFDTAPAVISMNRAAATYLGIPCDDAKRTPAELLPEQDISNLFDPSGERHEMHLELKQRGYLLSVSPIMTEDTCTGYVLLIFDVTEQNAAEQMRREFTANVSHELKTPLHSISGCAELLSAGLVKPEDTKRFSNQIYTEAKRLIRLVDDIIKLSSLDEGVERMERSTVDLYSLAGDTVASLQSTAQTAEVELSLTGEPSVLSGIPQLLSGIVFNLCDNAIKYNHPGGRVDVSVTPAADCVTLRVSDTGIGIPEEHLNRIFERFYRVDKSHSKEVGGTGLGLAIVKHAARLHHAQIKVESKVGQGSVFTVSFPIK